MTRLSAVSLLTKVTPKARERVVLKATSKNKCLFTRVVGESKVTAKASVVVELVGKFNALGEVIQLVKVTAPEPSALVLVERRACIAPFKVVKLELVSLTFKVHGPEGKVTGKAGVSQPPPPKVLNRPRVLLLLEPGMN